MVDLATDGAAVDANPAPHQPCDTPALVWFWPMPISLCFGGTQHHPFADSGQKEEIEITKLLVPSSFIRRPFLYQLMARLFGLLINRLVLVFDSFSHHRCCKPCLHTVWFATDLAFFHPA